MATSNNSRIAKNTIYLYLRTLVVMLVSLYTSRLVLQALGETDMGIYNLVGGIVTLMAFLQSAQTRATSRFLTFELGQGKDSSQLNRTFSICMTIHIILCLIILALAETIGLFIINYWTSIPSDRLLAANIVYQLSVVTFVIHFVRVPYDSLIVAYENFSIYAYMSVIEVFLQLGMVVGLLHIGGDSLVYYGSAICLIAFILFLAYKTYVKINLKTYRYHWLWDKNAGRKILSFSGWTLLGSTSNTVTQQGVSLLLNNFVGLVANAALGFANQVNAAVSKFLTSFTTAFNPQIIKYYAQEDYRAMYTLINRASKFSFILCYIMALPLIANMPFILSLWLKDVPLYTTEFCQLIIVCTVIDATSSVFNTAITATGNVRNYQIYISISFVLDLICAACLLLLKVHPALVFGSRILTRGFLNMLISILVSKKLLKFNVGEYFKDVIFPIAITIMVTIPAVWIISRNTSGWSQLVLSTTVSTIAVVLCLLMFVMNKTERNKIFGIIQNRIHGRIKI